MSFEADDDKPRVDCPPDPRHHDQGSAAAPPPGPGRHVAGGSGTSSIPGGGRIATSTPPGGVIVDGPNGQRVALGAGVEILDSRSPMAGMAQQLGQADNVLIAPFADPDRALVSLAQQLNQRAQSRGEPTETLDRYLDVQPLRAILPGGRAQAVYYASTIVKGGSAVAYRTRAQLESYVLGDGEAWGLYFGALVTAPDATFDRDQPTLIAIAKSWQLDDARVQANTRAIIAEQNRRVAAFEDAMRANQAAFDAYLHSVQNASVVRSRGNADFDEVIRGVRTVEDTAIGERALVDLGNVHDVVDRMNRIDPGRYREIPLR